MVHCSLPAHQQNDSCLRSGSGNFQPTSLGSVHGQVRAFLRTSWSSINRCVGALPVTSVSDCTHLPDCIQSYPTPRSSLHLLAWVVILILYASHLLRELSGATVSYFLPDHDETEDAQIMLRATSNESCVVCHAWGCTFSYCFQQCQATLNQMLPNRCQSDSDMNTMSQHTSVSPCLLGARCGTDVTQNALVR